MPAFLFLSYGGCARRAGWLISLRICKSDNL